MTGKHELEKEMVKGKFDPKKFFIEPIVFRTMMIFYWNKGRSRADTHRSLEELFGKGCISKETVGIWFSKFELGDYSLETEKHIGRPIDLETTDIVCKMVEKDNTLSMHEIARLTGIPYPTVRYHLFHYGGYVSMGPKIVPYILDEDKKKKRVEISKQMLKILESTEKKGYIGIITGDESWIFQRTNPKRILAKVGDEIPTAPKETFREKKMMICVFMSCKGFHVLHRIAQDTTLKHEEYLDKVIKPACINAKERFKEHKIFLHHDNSPVHKTEDIEKYLDTEGVKLIPQPPYSPDLAPCDFFLWGKLKVSMMGRTFENQDKQLEYIKSFLGKILEDELYRVFNHWEERLLWVIDNNGDYYYE